MVGVYERWILPRLLDLSMPNRLCAYAERRPGDCGHYINSNGHRVPSPCGNSETDTPPPRATAICRDGSCSFSEHPFAGGACSHHGEPSDSIIGRLAWTAEVQIETTVYP